MTNKVTIRLRTPLRGPNGARIREVIIREPNVTECLSIGDPYVVGSSPTGSQIVVENYEAISEYVRRCVIEPADPALLEQGGVFLARKLKEAVINFFLNAEDGDAVSATSSMISPSADTEAAGSAKSEG